MEPRLVDRPDALEEVRDALASGDRFALDCEAAGFHRYSDRLCLVQLTAGGRTWVLDPLALPLEDLLRPVLEDADREVVMHGADFDLRLLDRDLGIRPRSIFDTQVAASLLGISGIGLSSLLERTLGVSLSKKYQRADWARRPLPEAMLRYAALDTHYLVTLAVRLERELQEAGRMEWAREEFAELERIRYEPPEEEDPAARVRAARDLSDREVHRLREALAWRDSIAKERDRAPFRVVGDPALVEIARAVPGSVDALEGVRGLNAQLAREEGPRLLERLREADALDEAEIVGLPHRARDGRGRPEPDVEERMARLKKARNRTAAELEIDRGTLLPNAQLMIISEAAPTSIEELAATPGLRKWQCGVLGSALVDLIRHEPVSAGD